MIRIRHLPKRPNPAWRNRTGGRHAETARGARRGRARLDRRGLRRRPGRRASVVRGRRTLADPRIRLRDQPGASSQSRPRRLVALDSTDSLRGIRRRSGRSRVGRGAAGCNPGRRARRIRRVAADREDAPHDALRHVR